MSEQTVKLGSVIDESAERDAIHIAVAPVVAGEKLFPGQDIGLLPDGRAGVVSPLIGIVDPFLNQRVYPDQRFYMLLYPNTITSLRHEWVHPAFKRESPPRVDTASSEQWLKDYADQQDLTYDELMRAAVGYLDHGDYLIDGGKYEGESVPDDFWNHFQVVTGRLVADSDRGTFFSCSC